MRKLVSLLSLAISLTLLYSTPIFAQKESTPAFADDTTIIDQNFDENLDSLLNLYYVGHSIGQNPDFWNSEADSLIPDFSDSVYIDRLEENSHRGRSYL